MPDSASRIAATRARFCFSVRLLAINASISAFRRGSSTALGPARCSRWGEGQEAKDQAAGDLGG